MVIKRLAKRLFQLYSIAYVVNFRISDHTTNYQMSKNGPNLSKNGPYPSKHVCLCECSIKKTTCR